MACRLLSLRISSGVSFLGGAGGRGPPGGAGRPGRANEDWFALALAGCDISGVTLLGIVPDVADLCPRPG